MYELSDEALLAGYAGGDPNSGALFVRRFAPRVFGIALQITRDRRDAEEVAQDAFVRAWRYAASFDARRGTLKGWLLGIARNVALDRARVLSRRREDPQPNPLVDLAGAGLGPEDVAEQRDTLAWVAEQLRSLPVEHRDALLAASVYGMTAREIAELSGVPIGTVKTRIRAALRQLRERVPEGGPCD